ncbi:MAG: DUF2577 domain-containing protein [Lysinibacillus sp.]
MASIVELIKTTALKAFEASNPVNVLFGTVKSTNPIAIEVHQKLTLTKEFIILTKATESLVTGDKVVLLRVQGGQQFVALDKVVS